MSTSHSWSRPARKGTHHSSDGKRFGTGRVQSNRALALDAHGYGAMKICALVAPSPSYHSHAASDLQPYKTVAFL